MKARWACLIVGLVFAVATLACGSSQGGSKVATKAPAATATAVTVQTYKVGDVIEVEKHQITMNSAEFAGDVLTANFTVENKGTEDLVVSSMLSFSVKDTEGTKLEQTIDCSSMIDGKVLPGDKSKGNICWKGAAAGPFRVYYQASFLGSGAVVWEVAKP